jgi:hypothetical protein
VHYKKNCLIKRQFKPFRQLKLTTAQIRPIKKRVSLAMFLSRALTANLSAAKTPVKSPLELAIQLGGPLIVVLSATKSPLYLAGWHIGCVMLLIFHFNSYFFISKQRVSSEKRTKRALQITPSWQVETQATEHFMAI